MTTWAKVEHRQLSEGETKGLNRLLLSLDTVLAKHLETRVNGNVSSERTQQLQRTVLAGMCRRLYDLGYQVQGVSGIDSRHITALVQDWHKHGLKNKTLENYVSVIRRLTEWINKPNLIPSVNALQHYLPNVDKADLKVKTYTDKSKSWTENGVDVSEKIKEAESFDTRFSAMLLLGFAFGLRRKEQLRIILSQADGGDKLMIRGSVGKSGRDRDIQIEHPFQRFCLDRAKKVAGKNQPLGWPGLSYQQSIERYNYYLRHRLGISGKDSQCVGHGLRAEFVENEFLRLGFVPPTLGGSVDQMPREQFKTIAKDVMAKVGHNRITPTGAYCGSLARRPKTMGKPIGRYTLPDDSIGTIYMNPLPTPAQDGSYPVLRQIEKQRTLVHLTIEAEGKAAPLMTVRVEDSNQLEFSFDQEMPGLEAFKSKVITLLKEYGWH